MRSRVLLPIVLATTLFGMLTLQGCFGASEGQPAPVAPAPPPKVEEKIVKATPTPSVPIRHVERTPKVKWSFDAGKNDLDSLAMGRDGTIYAASVSKVLAVSSKGTQKWLFDPGNEKDRVSALVAGHDGNIYLGNLGGKVLALSPDGAKNWSFDAGKPVFSVAAGSNGDIYAEAGVFGGKVLALSPKGVEKWSFDCGDCTSNALAVGRDGTVYAVATHGSDSGKVVALSPEGASKWSFDARSSVRRLAVGSNGAIYVGTTDAANNGKVLALSAEGAKKWSFDFRGGVWDFAMGRDGSIYANTGDSHATKCKVFALSPEGAAKWSFDAGKVSSLGVGRGGIIYAGTMDEGDSGTDDEAYTGKVLAFSPTGSKKWSFNVGGSGVSALAVGTGRVIYAATSQGDSAKVIALTTP